MVMWNTSMQKKKKNEYSFIKPVELLNTAALNLRDINLE